LKLNAEVNSEFGTSELNSEVRNSKFSSAFSTQHSESPVSARMPDFSNPVSNPFSRDLRPGQVYGATVRVF
jgi:hypothetical protein